MSDGMNVDAMTVAEKRAMVSEARETFGIRAARELWAKLGLPGDLPAEEPKAGPIGCWNRGKQHDWPKFMCRMPPDMKRWIAMQAAANASTMNSELVRCVRERMERESETA